MKDRKVKRALSGDWYQWEGGGYKERVQKGEYGGNIMYLCINGKMRPVETIPGIGGGSRRMVEGKNLTKLLHELFCKVL
jgi:hypothetical protein